MLDRILRLVFRDFSTFFLIIATLVLPLELVYGAAFRDVAAVRELHAEIAELPEEQAILGVSADRLQVSRGARWGLNLLQLALVPLFVRAARRMWAARARGRLPTLLGALGRRHMGPPPPQVGAPGPSRYGVVGGAAIVSLAIGLLVLFLGNLVIEPIQGPGAWPLVALVQTSARAMGGPFLVGALAALAGGGEGEER